MQPRLPQKKQIAEALLSESMSVFIHLDPRRERVSVPPQFRQQPHLILEVGLNMPVPIRDLTVDDEGITCTLSFNRSPFWCRMPWACVFALVSSDQRGMVWPDDVPQEVAFKFQRPAPNPSAGESKQASASRGPRLVPAPEPSPDDADDTVESAPATTSDRPPLEAVPEAPAAAPDAPEANEPDAPDATEPDAPEATEPDAPDAKPEDEGGGKRKLPSYLRVVK